MFEISKDSYIKQLKKIGDGEFEQFTLTMMDNLNEMHIWAYK